MRDLLNLQKTIAFYCRDFLEDLDGYDRIVFDRQSFRDAVFRAIESEYDENRVADMYHILDHVAVRIMAVYSKYPGIDALEKFYMRARSLMDLCADLLKKDE